METCFFKVAFDAREFNHLPGAISRVVLPPGGTDTCTLRGEDCQYCGAFHLILELGLSRPSDDVILSPPQAGEESRRCKSLNL